MIILGIDPGTATTGYALLKRTADKKTIDVLDYGIITTLPEQLISQRFAQIYREISQLIKQFKPDSVAVEKVFFAKNVKTAMRVGQTEGIVLLIAEQFHLVVKEFTPLEVKQALIGYGRASKRQIQEMVQRLLKLKQIPSPDDAADALAIALTYLQTNFSLKE